jgi:hypothetical protein
LNHSLLKGLLFILLPALLFIQCNQPVNPDQQNAEKYPIDRHAKHFIYTLHAICRMDCRHITEREIGEILEKGEINYGKSDPRGRPDPKYALEGYTHEKQHLRVIFAPSPKGMVVITCIDLGVEWQCDCN